MPRAGDLGSDLLHLEGKYGGMEAADIRRLKEVEEENGRLKRMYADLALEVAALKDVIAKKL